MNTQLKGSRVDDLTVGAAHDMLVAEPVETRTENEPAVAEALSEVLDALDGGAGPGEPDGSAMQVAYTHDAVGLGVDIVEIARMDSILARTPAFARRVFSEEEQAYCDKTARPATHYALRFAAKEAVVKALGTGIAEGIDVLDIEVQRAANGRPSVKLSGRALEIAREQGVRSLSISLSYTRTDAVACALAITDAAAKAVEKRKDPMEELARQFKETRGILDEL